MRKCPCICAVGTERDLRCLGGLLQCRAPARKCSRICRRISRSSTSQNSQALDLKTCDDFDANPIATAVDLAQEERTFSAALPSPLLHPSPPVYTHTAMPARCNHTFAWPAGDSVSLLQGEIQVSVTGTGWYTVYVLSSQLMSLVCCVHARCGFATRVELLVLRARARVAG